VDRILTTHVGSLWRPAELVESVRHAERGEPVDERALAGEREAVRDLVRERGTVAVIHRARARPVGGSDGVRRDPMFYRHDSVRGVPEAGA